MFRGGSPASGIAAFTGGTAKFDDGAVGSPSIAFASAATTGFYLSGGAIRIAVGGTVTHQFSSNSMDLLVDAGTIRIGVSADVSLARGAAGIFKFASANSFSANAAVATVLGSVGPTGAQTTVQKWLTIKDDGGTTRYIPCF